MPASSHSSLRYLFPLAILGMSFAVWRACSSPTCVEPPRDPGLVGLATSEAVFHSNALTVYLLYGRYSNEVRVERVERFPGEVVPEDYVEGARTLDLSTSFALSRIASRHADELYVAGLVPRTGDVVIERWTFPRQNGAYYTERESAPAALGPSVSESVLSLGVHETGQAPEGPLQHPWTLPWIEPAGRPNDGLVPPLRTELFRGTEVGEVADVAVDPEGRFLLLTGMGDAAVTLFLLADPPQVHPLYDDESLPGLAPGASVDVVEHENLGRTYRLTCSVAPGPADDTFLFLHDPNNDGLFDSEVALTRPQFEASADYAPLAKWVDDYRSYLFDPGE